MSSAHRQHETGVTRACRHHRHCAKFRPQSMKENLPMAPEGMSSVPSTRPVGELIERLEAALAAKNITIFGKIDHAAGAAKVGQPLRPMIVLIFGNPAAGTPLMQAEQTIGLDLPLRILAWEDERGGTWLTYHELPWLARQYGLDPAMLPPLAAMSALLKGLTAAAAGLD
jgi:uncharacterized protein (DUF302 family)